jgi:hypothetical protein
MAEPNNKPPAIPRLSDGRRIIFAIVADSEHGSQIIVPHDVSLIGLAAQLAGVQAQLLSQWGSIVETNLTRLSEADERRIVVPHGIV